MNRLFVTCALVNLFLVRKRLLCFDGGIVAYEAAEPPHGGQKQRACLVGRTKPPAIPVSALRFAVKITCSEIP